MGTHATLVILGFLAVQDLPATEAPAIDGVYMSCAEVAGYERRTLELCEGRYRLWWYSDVRYRRVDPETGEVVVRSGTRERRTDPVTGKQEVTDLPVVGTYTFDGSSLTLASETGSFRLRFEPFHGQDVLWRESTWEGWVTEGRLNLYGLWIRTAYASADVPERDPPPVVPPAADVEGLYVAPRESAAPRVVAVELEDGRYRLWDDRLLPRPRLASPGSPGASGRYELRDHQLLFRDEERIARTFRSTRVFGHDALLTEQGYEAWLTGRLDDLAPHILFKADAAGVADAVAVPRSFAQLRAAAGR